MNTSNNKKATNCVCDICNIEFYKRPDKIKNNKKHYCSLECIQNNPNSKLLVKCLYCGSDFLKKAHYVRNSPNHFCSHNCSASYNNIGVRRNGNEPSNCLNCEERLKESSRKYCSVKCNEEHIFETQIKKYENGEILTPSVIKKYLIIKNSHKCSVCNLEEWCGNKIPLVMDHIDGNSENNLPANLRLVCGNCDMQLPTYKSKNKGNGRAFRRQRYAEGKSY